MPLPQGEGSCLVEYSPYIHQALAVLELGVYAECLCHRDGEWLPLLSSRLRQLGMQEQQVLLLVARQQPQPCPTFQLQHSYLARRLPGLRSILSTSASAPTSSYFSKP